MVIAAVLLAGAVSATAGTDPDDGSRSDPVADAPTRSPPRELVPHRPGRQATTARARTAPPPPPPPTSGPSTTVAPPPPPPTGAVAPPAGPVVNRPPPGPERTAPSADPPRPVTPESTAVHPREFADPSVVQAHGSYWAFSTQSRLHNVPVMRSTDLVHWEFAGDAMRRLPSWAEWGRTWAPAVLPRGSTFVLYYATRHAATGLQCISRAVGVLPQGPYVDDSDEPMICQTDRGGSIDPSPFVDADGRAWLLWKSEGTRRGDPTRLWVQALSPDGTGVEGSATELLARRLPWEFPIIENPSMVLVEGRHHLLYSGNRWETSGYAVGHAVCESVTGPCRRSVPHPVLASRIAEAGPGGQDVVRAPNGDLVLVHHAWSPEAVGYHAGGSRRLHVSAIRFHGDRVSVGGPWRERSSTGLLGGPG